MGGTLARRARFDGRGHARDTRVWVQRSLNPSPGLTSSPALRWHGAYTRPLAVSIGAHTLAGVGHARVTLGTRPARRHSILCKHRWIHVSMPTGWAAAGDLRGRVCRRSLARVVGWADSGTRLTALACRGVHNVKVFKRGVSLRGGARPVRQTAPWHQGPHQRSL